MNSEFIGQADPMDEVGFQQALSRLGAEAPCLWAVLNVETSGCGFQPDRRPRILFERHIFSARTQGRFNATHPDVSNPVRGGYDQPSKDQYERLNQALALDRQAALQSASWGIGQVMGSNAQEVGYPDAEAMVRAMCESESAQIQVMSAFIVRKGLHKALQRQDWAAFALGYNGPSYRDNQYDAKLAAQHALAQKEPPDLVIRRAQMYLTYLGFAPGPVDGRVGARSQSAWDAFCVRQGLPHGVLDVSALPALRCSLEEATRTSSSSPQHQRPAAGPCLQAKV